MISRIKNETALAPTPSFSNFPDAREWVVALDVALQNNSHSRDNLRKIDATTNIDDSESQRSTDTAAKGSDRGDAEKADHTNLRLSTTKSLEEKNHVTGFKLIIIVVCLMLAIFCVALDNTSQYRPSLD